MLKYAEIRDTVSNKLAGAKVKIKDRIERNRAEEKRTVESEGTLDVEYTNNWRERVNCVNENDELEFETYHKKIHGVDGDYYVLNVKTPNLDTSLEPEEDGEENGEENQDAEGEDQDGNDEHVESEEDDVEVTVTVEDDKGRSRSLDVRLGDEEDDEEDEDEQEDEKERLGANAVEELYLDVAVLFADEHEDDENVHVPYQRPVLREVYEVEDIYEAEDIVEQLIKEYDGDRIDEMLEKADEDDVL
jgi:hypothetical protein